VRAAVLTRYANVRRASETMIAAAN
jgi:hypothetical protein